MWVLIFWNYLTTEFMSCKIVSNVFTTPLLPPAMKIKLLSLPHPLASVSCSDSGNRSADWYAVWPLPDKNVGSSGGKPVVGPAIVVASSCLRMKIILKHSYNYCWVIFIVCVTNVCQRRCFCLLQPLQKSWSDVISLDYLFAVSCRLNDA